MSVVAARITPKGYEIAADSIMVYGWSQRKDCTLAKLNEVNGLVLGGVGTAEENMLFYLYLKEHRPSPTEDSIVTCLSEFAAWKNARTGSAKLENSFLIGFDRDVFSTYGYHVNRVAKFEAIGAGMDFANAALHLGHSAEQAVAVAIELSPYCEGPIVSLKRSASRR